jgi:hypothetical protein
MPGGFLIQFLHNNVKHSGLFQPLAALGHFPDSSLFLGKINRQYRRIMIISQPENIIFTGKCRVPAALVFKQANFKLTQPLINIWQCNMFCFGVFCRAQPIDGRKKPKQRLGHKQIAE